MPQTRECDYCGATIDPGTGTMFVRTNGTTVHFCSGKCEKNADLGREPRDLEWTEAGQAAGGEAVPESEEPEPETEPVAEEAGEGTAAPDLDEAEAGLDDQVAAETESSQESAADDADGEDSEDAGEEAEA
jgi:large subunit ribosomal protein L24e